MIDSMDDKDMMQPPNLWLIVSRIWKQTDPSDGEFSVSNFTRKHLATWITSSGD